MSDATLTERDEPTESDREASDLRAQLELLERENSRLREAFARARQTRYRRAATGLALVGLVAVAGGLAFPAVRDVLFGLGAVGLFGAVLTYYLTPERFVAAETGERVYDALSETEAALVGQLGLTDERVYVPTAGSPPARLFVPQHADYEIPAFETESPLVVTENDRERGAGFVPSGAYLFAEFERTLAGPLADNPTEAVSQLGDGLVEGFELAESFEADVDDADGRASVRVTGSVFGGADRFDNPLASFLAVGLARALGRPTRVELTDDGDDGFVVTVRWSADETDGGFEFESESDSDEENEESEEKA